MKNHLVNSFLIIVIVGVVSTASYIAFTMVRDPVQNQDISNQSISNSPVNASISGICGSINNPLHSTEKLMALPNTITLSGAKHTVTIEAYYLESDKVGEANDDEVRRGMPAANIPFMFSDETQATFRTGQDGKAVLKYPEKTITILTDRDLLPYFGGGAGYAENYSQLTVDHDITLVVPIWEPPLNIATPDPGQYPLKIKTINRYDDTSVPHMPVDMTWSDDNTTWHDCQVVTDANGEATIMMPRSLVDTQVSQGWLGGGDAKVPQDSMMTIELIEQLF